MQQTRLESFVETLVNIVIGYAINFLLNLTVFPMYGYNVTVQDNITIGLIFTVVSVARSYTIRRYFETTMKSFNRRAAEALQKVLQWDW